VLPGMTLLPQLTPQEAWQLTAASAALGFPKRPKWQVRPQQPPSPDALMAGHDAQHA
jgi:hypothetical protein